MVSIELLPAVCFLKVSKIRISFPGQTWLPLNVYGIVAILHPSRKHPFWQKVWQESPRDRCIQSSLGTSHESYGVSEAGSTCWEPDALPWKSPLWCSKPLGFFLLGCLPVPRKDDESHHGSSLLSGGRLAPSHCSSVTSEGQLQGSGLLA